MNQREHQRAISAMVFLKSHLDASIPQYQSDSLASKQQSSGLEITEKWIAIFRVAASAFLFVHC